MATYRAPLEDMLFVLRQLAGIDELAALPDFADAGYDTARAVLEECAKFNEGVVAPLNRSGDLQPATLDHGEVKSSPGFAEAFRGFAEGGWQGVQHPEQFGGQGLPKLVATPCIEMLNSANLSFALCPLLTDGAIEALLTAGSPTQQALYVPNLISGDWTGTMNLTEPQAGSDLALVRTKAVPQPDGSYRIFGQKIFITYGEHDMAKNIVHLVLARTPDAPEGIKGISLFVVPKYMVDEQGESGKRNDVWCASIEHKLGISASPTAVLLYGDDKGEVGAGAIGYRIGEENRGLEYMFVMMNAARFAVGIQGIAVAERAYQQAVAYAKERVQSRDVAGSSGPVTIIHHPDVRRLLMSMRAQTEAARALAYVAAAHSDWAHHATDDATREQHRRLYEYLVPIVKGWSTEMSIEVASLGVQVHGGMGFIEETGAAQYYRDARILTIYEGTTAIQANDFVGRKTVRDRGAVARQFLEQVRETEQALEERGGDDLVAIAARLRTGREALSRAVDYVVDTFGDDVRSVFAGSVPYLKLAGVVLCGWQMARAASKAQAMRSAGVGDARFLDAKITTARFYADHILVQAPGIADTIVEGARGVLALPESAF
ncbi:MAG: acyl-CoA dehydrogenase [Burkholderiaceae bacterium]|nr:acyl-CoA dehydrogenase [Burkholderiaceae bacterium]